MATQLRHLALRHGPTARRRWVARAHHNQRRRADGGCHHAGLPVDAIRLSGDHTTGGRKADGAGWARTMRRGRWLHVMGGLAHDGRRDRGLLQGGAVAVSSTPAAVAALYPRAGRSRAAAEVGGEERMKQISVCGNTMTGEFKSKMVFSSSFEPLMFSLFSVVYSRLMHSFTVC